MSEMEWRCWSWGKQVLSSCGMNEKEVTIMMGTLGEFCHW